MKIKWYRFVIFSFLSVLFISLQMILPASAYEYRNYITTQVSFDKQQEYLDRLNFELLTDDSEKHPFECFAISSDGLIALGFDTSDDAIIYVYDTNGEFEYGFRFLNNHCAFTVFFEDEVLSIYWGKSRYIGSFDSEGNCLRLHELVNCAQNSDAYHSDRYRPNEGEINNIQYKAERVAGYLGGYTCFTIIDGANSCVIFDVSQIYRQHIMIFCVFAAVILWLLCYTFIKKRMTKSITQ